MTFQPTPEQQACHARGHKPWAMASRTVSVAAYKKARVRYCTGCGFEWGPHAGTRS